MNVEELIKTMVRSYFIIATGIIASMFVFCLVFYPNASFTVYDIGGILLLALLTDLPYLLFYSGTELSKKQVYLRKAVHLPVLLVIVICFAAQWNWLHMEHAGEVALLVVLIIAVYIIVFAMSMHYDKKTASQLNHRLKERYHSSQK